MASRHRPRTQKNRLYRWTHSLAHLFSHAMPKRTAVGQLPPLNTRRGSASRIIARSASRRRLGTVLGRGEVGKLLAPLPV